MKLANTPITLFLLASSIYISQPIYAEQTSSVSQHGITNQQEIQNIPIESLYQLLAAEMALDRIEPDVALANYIAAAEQTQDVAVAKRATEIALTVSSLDVALKPAKLWAQLAENDLEAQITLAAIYLRLHDPNNALSNLHKLSTINPEMANQHFLLLYQQLPEASEKDALVNALKQLSDKHPQAIGSDLSLAEIWLSKQQPEKALSFSQKAIKKQPNATEAIRMYSLTLAGLNQFDKAKQFIDDKIKTHPSLDLKRYYLDFLMTHNKIELGKEIFKNIVVDSKITNKEKLDLAKYAMQTQWYPEASDILISLRHDQEHKDVSHYFLARLSELKQDFPQAIEWYKQVLTGPFHILSQLRASTLLSEAKAYEDALLVLQRAHPQTLDDAKRLLMSEIDILINAKRYQTAFDRLNVSIASHPNDANLRYARSLVATSIEQFALAETDLKWIIEQQENHVDALNALGYLLTNHTKRYEEAYTYLNRALKLSPNNPVVLDSMGWLHFKMGDLEKSLAFLQQASGIVTDPEIAAHLGEVLWHLKDYKKARQIWDQGLALNPNNENILDAMERLMD